MLLRNSPLYVLVCQGKPADVMFLLDGSGSILPVDFQRQLDFVKDVINVFDVTSDVKTQVGVASFSNWAFQDFHLNRYSSVESMKKAVDSIRQIHGDTNTAAALAHLQDISFNVSRFFFFFFFEILPNVTLNNFQ